MNTLKFASTNQALQHLANLTGKRVKIAAYKLDEELTDKEFEDQVKSMFESIILDYCNDLQKENKTIGWELYIDEPISLRSDRYGDGEKYVEVEGGEVKAKRVVESPSIDLKKAVKDEWVSGDYLGDDADLLDPNSRIRKIMDTIKVIELDESVPLLDEDKKLIDYINIKVFPTISGNTINLKVEPLDPEDLEGAIESEFERQVQKIIDRGHY